MQCSIILLLGFLVLSFGVRHDGDPAWAAQASLLDKIQRADSHLQQLKQEIQETKKQRHQTQKKHDTVLQSIETLDQELYQKRKAYTAIRQEIRKTDRELEKLHQTAKQLDVSLQEREKAVTTRLRWLYMEGQHGWFRPLLSADSSFQFQRRLAYLSLLANRDRDLLFRYQTDMAQVAMFKDRQARVRKTLLRNKQRTAKNLNAIKKIKKKKQIMLTSLQHQTLSQKQTLSTLHRTGERKETLLDELRQRSGIGASRRQPQAVSRMKKGALLWPTQGPVVASFGRQAHPSFETYINKKGIEIQAREGSAIQAVFGGTVVFADWLKGYGLVVILDHHNGFFSFYAHASKLVVTQDDEVAHGDILGHTGASGLTDKSILYFELRKGTQPVDPQKWLVKR